MIARQPGGKYTANIVEKDPTSGERKVTTEISGTLLKKGTATNFLNEGKTGKFEGRSDSLVTTGNHSAPPPPNAVESLLINVLGLKPAAPDPVSYVPLPGRGMEVTIAQWDKGAEPTGSCQRMQGDKPIGSPSPIIGKGGMSPS